MSTVSVIVPNYNHAPFLRQRIESVLSQTFQDFELILLDDCSTDGSREILLSYKDNPHVSHVVFNEHNGGSPFKQWDKGIRLAQGEWIWIAESDDWADEDFLATLMGELEKHPECGLGFTLARYVYPDKEWCPKETGKTFVYDGKTFNCAHLLFKNEIYNVSMAVFRKDLYESVDASTFFDMAYCGDWMFYAQLCKLTSVLFVQKAYSYFRQHDSNTTIQSEHQGKTFLEGLEVVRYIANEYKVPTSKYSRHWGRQLANYERKYRFDATTKKAVKKYVRGQNPMINLWYFVYRMRKKCK